MTTTRAVLEEVDLERYEQDLKWDEQNHPVHGVGFEADMAAYYSRKADYYKRANDARASRGSLAWDGILLEEVYEALAETDPAKQRAELVQVAAVAVAAIECIDRRAQ